MDETWYDFARCAARYHTTEWNIELCGNRNHVRKYVVAPRVCLLLDCVKSDTVERRGERESKKNKSTRNNIKMNRTEIMTGQDKPEIAFRPKGNFHDAVKSISSADAKAPNRSPALMLRAVEPFSPRLRFDSRLVSTFERNLWHRGPRDKVHFSTFAFSDISSARNCTPAHWVSPVTGRTMLWHEKIMYQRRLNSAKLIDRCSRNVEKNVLGLRQH